LVAATIILRGPLGRALARRIEGGVPLADGASDRMAQLEHRVAELESAQLRMCELEERVDFTERMIARSPALQQLRSGDA
jgi:hypothetical protein